MRVLMTIDAIGGVWSYALELGSWLTTHGVQLVFASMGRALRPAQRRQLEAREITLEESEYRLEWMEEPWTDVERAGEWLLELERRHEPNVVHLNGYVHAAIGFRAPVISVAHSSVLSWWRAVFAEDAPEAFDRYRTEVRRGLRAAARIVAPTRAMLNALVEHEPWLRRDLDRAGLEASAARALVIENGIGSQHFDEREKEPFVLSASRAWDRAKNVALLARVAPNVSWPIQIAGEQNDESRAALAGSGLKLLGALGRERMSPLMRSAAIYAAPALYEPFGLSILEAAAGGAALVLGDIASLRELWGGAALFADARDAAAWATAIQALIDDVSLRRRLALAARARARRYSLERMGRAYLTLYQEIHSCRLRSSLRLLEVAQ
ncbi:MAG: glycosyltransferase [Myxococcota bacterium]